jgi:enoyl-CoA hydratase/carnithine racemase
MHVTDLINTIEHDGVLHATMQSPPRNSLTGALVEALTDVVAQFETGPARVLVLSSELPSWFANGEVTAPAPPADEFPTRVESLRLALARLGGCRKPSIAAVDGSAFGLGMELAMACTWRVCTPAARIGFPGVRHGALPSAGGSQRLPRLVGASRALDLILTGREIRGEEAMRIGLADRLVYRNAVEESLAMAGTIAAMPEPAVSLMIGCVEAALELPQHLGVSVERAALVALLDGKP